MNAAVRPIRSRVARGAFLVVIAVTLTLAILAVLHVASSGSDEDVPLAVWAAPGDGAAGAPSTAPATRPHADPATRPGPRREYEPDQVVQIVMDALQNNDDRDSGIVTTFNFASPGNKKLTGPVERFIPMVKSPAYQPMLNFQSAEYGELTLSQDKASAEQTVTLTTADGEVAVYLFHLSKQTDGEFKGCWMTDGVLRVRLKGKQA
jgi:hypothetical protein